MYKRDIRQLSGHVLAMERVLERDLKHHFISLPHVGPWRYPLTLKFTPHPQPQYPASTRVPRQNAFTSSSSSFSWQPCSASPQAPPPLTTTHPAPEPCFASPPQTPLSGCPAPPLSHTSTINTSEAISHEDLFHAFYKYWKDRHALPSGPS